MKDSELTNQSICDLMHMLEQEDAFFRSPDIDLDEALKRHAHAEQISAVLQAKLEHVRTDIEKLSADIEA